jgi:UPF0716 family protein affecting phage T7 exclusion
MKANEMPAESFLLGAVARMAAGMLLIAPGVLSDLLALLLLSPAGKWLTRIFLSSIFTRMLPQCSGDQFDFASTDKMSAKDEIIDVRVTTPDENNSHSERSEESE